MRSRAPQMMSDVVLTPRSKVGNVTVHIHGFHVMRAVELWDRSREMTARITWKPWMWSGQLPSLLRGVATPSLVVWGQHDRIVPLDCGQQYYELLADARLEIVYDAGHTVDLEQPELLAQLIADFVATVER